MNFIEALGFYFSVILDVTIYISFFAISFALAFLLYKKDMKKKDVILMICSFVGTYIALIIFSSLMFALSRIVTNEYLSRFIFALSNPIIVLIFSLIFVKGYPLHRTLKTLVLISSLVVIEVLSKNFGFFIGAVTHNIFILVVLARALPYVSFIGVSYLLWKIDINRYRNLSLEATVILFIVSSLLIIVSIYEQALMNQDNSITTVLSFLDITLLFVVNYVYFATYKTVENRHTITNLEVQKTLEDAEKMSLEIDENNREELEKIRHDLKNQLSYVETLLQEGKYKEAEDYIEEYLNNFKPVLNSFSCSNKVINSIINLELTKAKIKNITIDVKVVVPPLLPFKDIDLVSLLTNMIDNAIENYSSKEDETIIVRILKQNDFIRFIVSNPVDMDKISLGSLTVTKKVGRGHGYGTKIIKNIAKVYNGYVDFSVEDKRFITDAMLSLEVKND